MRTFIVSGLLFAGLSACAVAPEDHTADIHQDHAHVHGDGCGHDKIWHVDHWDYLHDGHLHHVHGDHVDEHVLEVTDVNPAGENPLDAGLHADHMHGADDAHTMVQHGDHMDYIHDGHLHHVHDGHVDDHGPVTVEKNS